MTIFELYLLTTIPKLGTLCAWVIPVSFLGMFISGMFMTIEDEELGRKWCKRFAKIGVTAAVLAVFIPSTSQLYTMGGGYIATNTDGVSKLPDNIVKAANDFLESIQKDAKDQTD